MIETGAMGAAKVMARVKVMSVITADGKNV
jgi:hypothetical protein